MLEYMKNLRDRAGHIPILVCGASVIVENERGEILLHLRNDNNCWAYPGGAVDIDEVVEEAAVRELYEETGIKANDISLFGVFSGKDMNHIYPNGDEISNVDIVFTCKKYEGCPKPDYIESDTISFFALDRLPENISPPCIRAIQAYARLRKL